MKTLLVIVAILAIASIESLGYTYSGFVNSPLYGYQNAKTYPINGTQSVYYELYVDKGGASVSCLAGQDQISSYTSIISKSGYITGYMGAYPDAVIYISAANFDYGHGYAHAYIYW